MNREGRSAANGGTSRRSHAGWAGSGFFWADGSGRFAVDPALGHGGQPFVGRLLLIQVLLEELRAVVVAQLFRPGDQGAVAGDLVMLHRLCGGQDGGVANLRVFDFAHEFLRLFGDPVDGRTVDALRLGAVLPEYLFQALDLVSGLFQVELKRLAKLRIGRLRSSAAGLW